MMLLFHEFPNFFRLVARLAGESLGWVKSEKDKSSSAGGGSFLQGEQQEVRIEKLETPIAFFRIAI
jgi:hypothetical protein